MLEPLKHFLKAQNIILASASPRRKEIFEKNLGVHVNIIPSKFPENLDKSTYANPADYVIDNSRLKALDVAKNIQNQEWFLVIGADTIVEMDKVIYEKPLDKNDAFRMLRTLSNKTHSVCTGVTLIKKKDTSNEFQIHSFSESSLVNMADLSDDEIKSYVESGEPLDKAGSYGIQGLGSTLVHSINGDFFNVEGFPAHRFAVELKKFLNN